MRYFLVVAEEGHFTRAAERLGMQQPPLSQQIRSLEQELGFDLFRRHPKGAELTAGGNVFLKEARAILASVDQAAARAARAAAGTDGSISLGLTSSAAAHPLIPQIVRAHRVEKPGVALEFKEGNAAELTADIAAGKLDIAFLRLPVSEPPGVAFQPLQEEEMLLVLPAGHPAIPKKKTVEPPQVALQALRDESFILVRKPGAPGMYAKLIKACEHAGFTPKIALEVDRMLTNISLVAAGVGISAVPASMRGFHAESVAYCRILTRKGSPTLGAPLTVVHREANAAPAVAQFLALATRFRARRKQPARR